MNNYDYNHKARHNFSNLVALIIWHKFHEIKDQSTTLLTTAPARPATLVSNLLRLLLSLRSTFYRAVESVDQSEESRMADSKPHALEKPLEIP